MKEGQTYCLFPTPIHHNNIGHNFKVEVNDLTTCYDSTIGPDSFDKPNGLITKDQNYLLNEENKLLRQKLEEVIDIYLRQHLRINKKVGIKHQCSWGLLHKKGHSSPRHYHRAVQWLRLRLLTSTTQLLIGVLRSVLREEMCFYFLLIWSIIVI
jgi:hypothetical protein